MKIRKNDKVKVITGKDKGKVAEVFEIFPERNLITVRGVNLVKKHVKGDQGGVITVEKPINVSNVMYYNDETSTPEKIGYHFEGNKKFRILRKSKKVLNK